MRASINPYTGAFQYKKKKKIKKKEKCFHSGGHN